MSENNIQIRKAAMADSDAVIQFVQATNFFRPVEMEIAKEVFDEAAAAKSGCSYQSYVAELNGRPVGWVCFGMTPCTLGTFDIYWIAVDPGCQRMHIGSKLLTFSEAEIRRQNGRLMVIETSGCDKYLPTQAFYERNGYSLAANVRDFYAPGDDKWIFIKKA